MRVNGLDTTPAYWTHPPEFIEWEEAPLDIKPFFYYLRDKDMRPMVTVCLLVFQGDIVARGVAICSQKDAPCKRVGRSIAKGRAMKAFIRKATSEPISFKHYAFDILRKVDPSISFEVLEKSSFRPVLTSVERMFSNKGAF